MTEFSESLKDKTKSKTGRWEGAGPGAGGPERPAGSKHAFSESLGLGCQLGQLGRFGRSAVALPPVRLVSLKGHMNVRP
jgi:hypothetical protein